MKAIKEILRHVMESPARTKDGHRIFDGTALGLYLPMNPNRHVNTEANLQEMARQRYGYGKWNAPYWFIGPEEGMAFDEDIQRRIRAWGHCDLNDCRKFHERIGEHRWHEAPVKLQKTWKQLILCLMAFKGQQLDPRKQEHKVFLRNYQSRHWGMQNGETCVIELSGLPA